MAQDTKDIFQGKKFKWSNMFSGFNSVKTKEEKERQFMSGLPGNVPYESDMIQEWTPPFLFYKFFIYSLVMLVLIFVCGYMYGFGKALLVSAAPYMIPVTILIFIWELNIPRNISVMDLLYIAVFSGITSYFVIFFVQDVTGIGYTDTSVFAVPLLTVVAKTLLVCIFLRKKSRGYGLNGLAVGAAVGAGYAILTLADDMYYLAEYAGEIIGIMGLIVVRFVMVLGGDIIWTAAIGAALALAKGKETLKIRHLGNSLFLICLIGTYLMEALWNYDITDLFSRFADSSVAVGIYTFLYIYQGKNILLLILSWALFFFVARKGVEQALEIAQQAKADKGKWDSKIAANYSGKVDIYGVSGMHAGKKFAGGSGTLVFGRDKSCGVRFAEDAKGISSLHCEIRKQGDHYVLIDKNSSYGTFLKDGKRLEPGKPYVLQDGMEFYLASEENAYKAGIKKEQDEALHSARQYGRRTNEIDGVEESGQNVYIACAVILAVTFLAFYAVSDGAVGLTGGPAQEQKGESDTLYGVWRTDETFDVKKLVIDNIDNVLGMAEIGLFKESKANGITITQDGMAYCTYNGATIDYAKFTCGIVDESTVHLQWSYSGAYGSVNIGPVGISAPSTYEAGFDVNYQVDGNTLYLDLPGMNLELHK